MKALRVLAFLLLAVFGYSAVSAQPHHKKHYKRHHRVMTHHRR